MTSLRPVSSASPKGVKKPDEPRGSIYHRGGDCALSKFKGFVRDRYPKSSAT